MRKKIIPISLFIISVFLGFLTFAQFNTDQFARSDDELGKLQDQENAVNILISEQAELKDKILILRDEIDTLSANKSYFSDKQKLDSLHAKIGLTEMQGAGISIEISPSSLDLTPEAAVIYSADLRDLIQRLWSADAQAISINDQRITALSPITPIGSSILVNDTRISSPFKINVIQGESVLAQELNFALYLPEIARRIDTGEYKITLANSELITMPVFTGRTPTDHLTQHND